MLKMLKPLGGKELNSNYFIQKRISVLFSFVGILVILTNVIFDYFLLHYSFQEIFIDLNVWLTTLVTLPFIFFILVKVESLLIQVFQLLIFLFSCTFTVLEQYNTIYGFAFWILCYILSIKYGFLKKHMVLKSSLAILYLFIITEISAYKAARSFVGLSIILFLTIFLLTLYIIFKSEIDRLLFTEKNLKKDIVGLIKDKKNLEHKIEIDQLELMKKESEIDEFMAEQVPFDLDRCRLTPTELKIVKNLVQTRGSNKDISKAMNIKESTVKQHLYRIFNKMGVDERYQIIDLCKYNFN